MNRNQFCFVALVALIGGVLGGIISGQFIANKFAFAKNDAPVHKLIKAEKFFLVDDSGKVRAFLGYKDKRTLFQMGDYDGYFFQIDHLPTGVRLGLENLKRNSIELDNRDDRTAINLTNVVLRDRIALNLDSKGDPRIDLYDDDRNIRLTIGKTELANKQTGSTEIRSEGSIVVFNEDGKVLRALP